MTEEVTNLIAKLRLLAGLYPIGSATRTSMIEGADALERSATETREAQAKAWDEAIEFARGALCGEEDKPGGMIAGTYADELVADVHEANPYISVAVVPKDPKPADPPLILCVTCSKRFADGETAWHHAHDKGHSLAEMVPARYGVTPTPEDHRCKTTPCVLDQSHQGWHETASGVEFDAEGLTVSPMMSDYLCRYCQDGGCLVCDFFYSTNPVDKLASQIYQNDRSHRPEWYYAEAREQIAPVAPKEDKP